MVVCALHVRSTRVGKLQTANKIQVLVPSVMSRTEKSNHDNGSFKMNLLALLH